SRNRRHRFPAVLPPELAPLEPLAEPRQGRQRTDRGKPQYGQPGGSPTVARPSSRNALGRARQLPAPGRERRRQAARPASHGRRSTHRRVRKAISSYRDPPVAPPRLERPVGLCEQKAERSASHTSRRLRRPTNPCIPELKTE